MLNSVTLDPRSVGKPPLAELPDFDLTRVIARVMKTQLDWSAERAQRAEHDYRVFLAGAKAQPEARLRPSSTDVDEIWHAHILHTKEYMRDCRGYLGRYLHHVPEDKDDCSTHCTSCLSCGSEQ